jgi:hypothetical protein
VPDGEYRPLSVLAVLSIVLAMLSVLVVFDWAFSVVPISGIAAGLAALRRIRNRSPELMGRNVAKTGILLSALIWGLAGGWLSYARSQEIPPGYIVIAYTELQADPDQPGERIPARAQELLGKKIYVKGYMYPGRQMQGLKQFLMSRDNGSCTFCMPDPQPTDLILVDMTGDMRVAYTKDLIHVGGKLSLVPEEQVAKRGGVAYRLEADYFN